MENLPNISPNRITVIIPNWNGMRWLNGCLTALSEQSFDCFNTLVVDNGSTDNSVQFIQDNFPEIQIECLQLNAGFAHAVNLGIKQSTTPYVVLLNTDTIVYPDWLGNLYQRIESAPDDIGAIASKLIQMDNPSLIDNAGDDLSWYGVATKIGNGKPIENYDQEREIFSPTAGATLYRREFLNKTGGFDSTFFAYLEDVDLGLRGRLMGYRFLYLPNAKVEHKSHGSDIKLAFYVELMTKNLLLSLTKNIPLYHLIKHSPELLYGQIYLVCAYGRPFSSIKGYISFILKMPKAIGKRRMMATEISLNNVEIDALLSKVKPSPAFLILLKIRIMGILGKFRNFRVSR